MKILIIDDDRTVCSSLKLLFSRKGYEVDTIHHPSEATEKIYEYKPQLILLDMNFTIDTSGKQGIKLLKIIREQAPEISIILMTGWATIQLAVKGMKLGAKDFIAKPWDNKDLLSSVNSILELHHNKPANGTGPTEENTTTIIGESDVMKEIMDMVTRVATTEASVLITGETGTGKELIAEAIHQRSLRNEAPFVKVNLGGIPSALFESEMFGHKKGAFTGAESDRNGRFTKAHTGTIFLDEIGELEMSNQVKMLRVLQEKTFEKLGSNQSEKTDVRVISATNRNLKNMCYDGQFREDLYYRINLINLHLPSLSERRGDIPLLVKHFIKNISELYNMDRPYIDDDTFLWLSRQEYKGNIRQLKNMIERGFLLHMNKKQLAIKHFMEDQHTDRSLSSSGVGLNLAQLEIDAINKALAKHNHAISGAAKALGITRSALYRRIEKYNLSHEPKI